MTELFRELPHLPSTPTRTSQTQAGCITSKYLTLLILPSILVWCHPGRQHNWDVATIQCTNQMLEIWPELVVGLEFWGVLGVIGRSDKSGIEWWRRKYDDHLVEVPENEFSITNIILNRTYHEIVSFERWNISLTCLVGRPVTHVYITIATCSSNETDYVLRCP